MIRRKRGARRIDPAIAHGRFRRWASGALCAGAATLAGVALVQGLIPLPQLEFPIRTLKVEGTFERVGPEQVAQLVAPYAAEGFFETDVTAIRQALTSLPWIHNAAVRRVWPDKLHIMLTEERAVARWGREGLVNAQGEVFYPERAEAAAELPVLEGPPRTSQQVMGHFRSLSGDLAPLGLRVTHLSMDARRALQLTLSNGTQLTLGRKDAELQVQRFVRFYPEVMAGHAADTAQVDLRYTNGFAVKWRKQGVAAQMRTAKKTGDAV